MVHVDLRDVKRAVFLVEVGDAQIAVRLQQVVEDAQDVVGVRHGPDTTIKITLA